MRDLTFQSATKEASAGGPPKRARRPFDLSMALLAVVIVIVALGTVAAVVATSGGPTQYACLTVSRSAGGSSVDVTSSGLIHYVNNQFYVSCSEGSSLPTNTLHASCLTITPKAVPASIGVGAGTYYYYLSTTSGSPVKLQGAAAPTNGEEIATPSFSSSGVSLVASC